MEKQLFETLGGWDIADGMAFQFYDCKLKTSIGKYREHDIISCILIDYGTGEIVLYDETGEAELHRGNLRFDLKKL